MNKFPGNTKPYKRLGQHFLRDENILKKIADFAKIDKGDTVVEIGPGEGTLTKILLERAAKVIAIEKDGALAIKLEQKFFNEIKDERLTILTGDILEIENLLKIAKLKIENYVLVGNIPYYITGEIFRKFLESERQPKSITFLVQKEVADRIMARDKKESVLSISIKSFGKPEFGCTVKAGAFYPRPKVDSAIIAVRDISIERLNEVSIERFFEIVKRGFAHKRKFLKSNLTKFSPEGRLQGVFGECGILENARAEDLKVKDWVCLAKNLL